MTHSPKETARLILYAMFLFLSGLGMAAYAAPRIHVRKDRVDFGEVWEGVKATHTFTIENLGDTELVIGNVRTS